MAFQPQPRFTGHATVCSEPLGSDLRAGTRPLLEQMVACLIHPAPFRDQAYESSSYAAVELLTNLRYLNKL